MSKLTYTTDRIAESLTKIRNAIISGKETVTLSNVKIVLEILKVLSNAGFIGEYGYDEEGNLKVNLLVDNKYKINELTRISKPGVRKYSSIKNVKPYKFGRGITILSTSHGVISDKEAKKLSVGGEILCQIW